MTNGNDPRVVVSPTADSAALAAAAEIVRRARSAVADRGSFTLAVSGGRSPWRMLEYLADHDMAWAETTIYQVDERIGLADDPSATLLGFFGCCPPDARPGSFPCQSNPTTSYGLR